MVKRKRPINKKNAIEKKDEGFFGILFFLASIYASLMVGIYSVIKEISSKTYLDWSLSLPSSVISVTLLGVMIIIGFYFFITLIVGVLEFSSYYVDLKPRQLKVKRKLRQMVLGSPLEIMSINFSLSVFLIMLLFVYFKTTFALIMGFVYLASFLFFTLNIFKMGKFVSSMTIKQPKPNIKSYSVLVLIVFLILSTIYIVFGAIVFNFAKFEINLDRELYQSNESAYITIYSKGIIKPIPYKVTYSNLETELNYTTHPQFGLAPIYIKINSSNLTEYPYNSYLMVHYNIPKPYSEFLLLRENLTQSQFIPVIKE